MVIEIFVMTNVAETQIKKNNGEIVFLKDLPGGLKGKLTSSLKMLKTSRVIVNTSEIEKSILVLVGQNKILSEIDGELKKKTKEALKLLVWYLGPHFYADRPGAIGADRYCTDCKSLQITFSKYCNSINCPSHKKWREIIGPSYELPKEDLSWPCLDLEIMTPEEQDATAQQVKALKP